ncbi:MAG: hypothetical protein IJV24_10270, partial [Prevotella sp.]|nr:hypothetical protein [Prevotella sp.]
HHQFHDLRQQVISWTDHISKTFGQAPATGACPIFIILTSSTKAGSSRKDLTRKRLHVTFSPFMPRHECSLAILL